ncbi:MAG TPA: DUF6701 domain-containing protein [Methylococcaceae bacterium]|nr:DUF6701 domain-containing protein [Methylococcaceae bacterium]
MLLLLFGFGLQTAHAACSAFQGDVTINEYNHQDNFIELKILDPAVDLTGWSVVVYDRNTLKSTTTGLAGSICAGDSSYIQFTPSSPLKGKDTTVALLDAAGNEVDWFYDSLNGTRPAPSCAGFPFDIALDIGNSGGKDFSRFPDGTGDWQISAGTGANSVQTPCAPNDSSLALAKSADKTTAYSGDAVVFTLTVQNSSSQTDTSLVVEDILPVGLSFASGSASSGSFDSATGLWNIPSLASGASATLTLTASIIASAPATLTNTARLIGSGTLFPSAGSSTPVATASASVDILVTPAPSVSGFNAFETATAAGSVTGVIRTKIAGTAYSLDVVALKSGNSAVETTFSQAVKVEVLGSTGVAPALDGNGCPVGATVLAAVSPNPTIAGGRATVAFPAEGDAWRYAKIRISHPAGSPTTIACSGDAFAIRPAALAAVARHTDWSTAGDGADLDNAAASGTPIHKAGRPFTLKATGYASSGAITGNYDGSPEAVNPAAVPPATVTGALAAGSFSAGGGTVVSDTASYSEAGAIALELQDQHFADVDAADSSTAERYVASPPFTAGRFVPDHFDLGLNTPQFAAGCVSGDFTYLDQPFVYATQPVIGVTARNAGGATTQNYTGSLWKIIAASLTGKSYTAASGTLDSSGVPAIDPVIADTGAGTGTLTFDSGTGLFFTRPASPSAPFDAEIALAINVIDSDGVAYGSNPAQFGAVSAGNGIAFSGGKAMRYGRLALGNAYGSELLDLPVPLQAQYWTGSYYTTNDDDGCTVIPSASVLLSNYQKNLNAGETTVSISGALTSGQSNLKLTKPGGGNNGSVDLTVDLSAAGLPWFGANPAALATFGVYGSNRTPVIYWREQY